MAISKEGFLASAAPLILQKGFHGTGIKDILDATGVTKGAFYYYFKDKDDFGEHYIRFCGERMRNLMQESLVREGLPLPARLFSFYCDMTELMEASGFSGGCPLGNLSQELPDTSPHLCQSLADAFSLLSDLVEDVLTRCREEGQLRPSDEIKVLALGLSSAWQGALMQSKLFKKKEPLNAFLRLHFGESGWFCPAPYVVNK